ncbi:S-adenosyl-L-methionine-dependent methyltransferase [Ochromonadaceae sp. CCMP2298]|nr:S-adenosyl-L-methionine-dependent methyltransferase [Ochromonadaceae sp. CCMP2298]
MSVEFWNDRYAEPGFAYGTHANAFLKSTLPSLDLPAGAKVLCLAEGEGRNAVHLAELGFNVTAVDFSAVGMAKLQTLALERSLQIDAHVADLTDFDLSGGAGGDGYALIVSIYAHMPPAARTPLHRRVAAALAPGGYILLEAYTPANVGRGTGGPQSDALCMSAELLRRELNCWGGDRGEPGNIEGGPGNGEPGNWEPGNLMEVLCEEVEEEVREGKYHCGNAAIVRAVFRKPA